MKRTLLFLTSFALFASVNIAAQKVWDFADTTKWPTSPAFVASSEQIVDNLGFYPGSQTITNFATMTAASAKTFPADATTNTASYSGTNYLKMNGTSIISGGSTVLPTQRFLYFDVSGACTVKIWTRTGSSSTRYVYVSNGTTLFGSVAATYSTTADNIFGAVNVPSAGRVYVYFSENLFIYKLEVSGATVSTTTLIGSNLSTTDNTVKNPTTIFANGSQVVVSKVSGDTKVNVYNTTGQLVKSFNTKNDASFSLKPGIYIVNAKSDKGEKSQKVIVK